jgi:hypothetical protein
VTITPTSGGSAVTSIEVFDQHDGTYKVAYVATSTASTYTISVTVNADTPNAKTTTLTVVSSTPSVTISTIAWTSWVSAALTKVVDLGVAYNFLTSMKDAHSNPKKETTLSLVTVIEGRGTSQAFTATLASAAAAEYTTAFTLPTSASTTDSLCGAYTLKQYWVQSGGLTAKYYANRWFSPAATPALERVDAVVNFNWPVTEDIIPSIAREQVSIVWEGYLLPGSTSAHSFRVAADDGVKVTVDGVAVIDSMIDATAGT